MPDQLPPVLPDAEGGKPSIVLPPQMKGGAHVFSFRQPRGDWRVSIGGFPLKPYDLCRPDRTYRVEANMLCGSEVYDALECSPVYVMTAVEFARRVQVVASIQHVTRRACKVCREAYRDGLSPDEKRWLYSTAPTMGRALGFEGAEVLADIEDGRVRLKDSADPRADAARPYVLPSLPTRAGSVASAAGAVPKPNTGR